jgi:hypothetical protein
MELPENLGSRFCNELTRFIDEHSENGRNLCCREVLGKGFKRTHAHAYWSITIAEQIGGLFASTLCIKREGKSPARCSHALALCINQPLL